VKSNENTCFDCGTTLTEATRSAGVMDDGSWLCCPCHNKRWDDAMAEAADDPKLTEYLARLNDSPALAGWGKDYGRTIIHYAKGHR
jgi:hypothetical protein